MTTAPTRLLRRFRRDAQGVTAVEFGIVGGVLVMFIVGVVEIGLMMAAQSTLDNATFLASRTGKTGYVATGSDQQAMILAAVKRGTSGYIDANQVTMTSKSYGDYANIGQPEPFTDLNLNGKRDAIEPYTDVNGNKAYDTDQGKTGYGASGQIVVYTAQYDWRMITPLMSRFFGVNGVVTLKSRIVVKNEPYE